MSLTSLVSNTLTPALNDVLDSRIRALAAAGKASNPSVGYARDHALLALTSYRTQLVATPTAGVVDGQLRTAARLADTVHAQQRAANHLDALAFNVELQGRAANAQLQLSGLSVKAKGADLWRSIQASTDGFGGRLRGLSEGLRRGEVAPNDAPWLVQAATSRTTRQMLALFKLATQQGEGAALEAFDQDGGASLVRRRS